MTQFPYGHNQLSILIFRFIDGGDGGLGSPLHTSSFSCHEALDRYRQEEGEFIETEIVVSARKGRYKNPVTHKLAHLEKEHPGTWFVAAVDERLFRQMCQDAELRWRKEKAALRNGIRDAAHDNKNASLDDLPAALRERIKIQDSGCWLWLLLYRKDARGKLKKNKRVFPHEYGRARFKGKMWKAHTLVYTLLVGAIPTGTLLRHSCDTPACVNPLHLQLGITEDNVGDMLKRKRHPWQVKARRREEKRQAYLHRKERKKSVA